jgi:lipopolysaccharide export system protein LptA
VTFLNRFAAAVVLSCLPGLAMAQAGALSFGQGTRDRAAPVEVSSDALSVDQNDNSALFTGSVVIAQGEMRLAAPRVRVVYLPDRSGIETLEASGGVTLTSGEDAAEAQDAAYNLGTGMIELRGNVLLVQGTNAISGDTVIVDTNAGTAQVTGRVKTILRPQENQ